MRLTVLGILIVAAALLGGCAGTMPGPGQPFGGSIFTATQTPGMIGPDQEYQANPEKFDVLGMTEGSSGNFNFLGLFTFGNGGYIPATTSAMRKVGADGLINCVADVKTTSFLFIFSSTKTVVHGLAIKKKP